MKTGLVIAAAAAALFVAGCATEGTRCATPCQPACQPACACKGMANCKGQCNSCKGQAACKGACDTQCQAPVKKHRRAHRHVVKAAPVATSTSTTTTVETNN